MKELANLWGKFYLLFWICFKWSADEYIFVFKGNNICMSIYLMYKGSFLALNLKFRLTV